MNVERTIGILSEELQGALAEALERRRDLLGSDAPVPEKYAFPRWEDRFADPVNGETRSFREILQGLIDNFLGRRTEGSWRLNDAVPIPGNAHPLRNPGLELTGPWHPLDMAIKQINADVAATMGPDDEDAAPADYVPFGSPEGEPVGLFVSRDNERRILARSVRETSLTKKGTTRTYRIEKPSEEWPTSFHRVPGIHLRTPHVPVGGRPASAFVVDYVLHVLNDYGALRRHGGGLFFYQPKIQHPSEAFLVARLVWTLERLLGARKPGSLIKFKALYEEANVGRYLPVVLWMWRHWLIGTNVGRWDYTGSLIEMWKDERVLPDPQNGARMGMTSPHMMTYQRYNALVNLMAGMKGHELTHGAPIGGMAAVMQYPEADPYRRSRHNPVTLRAITTDKLRERLIGLIFVPEEPFGADRCPTLSEILRGTVKGRLYDTYRQSWVASPDPQYVAAGNAPLRAPVEELQVMVDATEEWEEADGRPVAPKVRSGLSRDERKLLTSLRLLDERGEITPWVIPPDSLDTPEKLLSGTLWGEKDLWGSLYDVPEGEITAENFQHAFYMAANYGFQLLNGNLAAAIDDYQSFPGRVVRFMNDLATYRIFVGWLWTVVRHRARITADGWLRGPLATEDGIVPGEDAVRVPAGTAVTPELFDDLWRLHDQWTRAFFDEFDRQAAEHLIAAASKEGKFGGSAPAPARTNAAEVPPDHAIPEEGTPSPMTNVGGPAVPFLPGGRTAAEGSSLPDRTAEVRGILSEAYGAGSRFERRLSYAEAADRISGRLGIDRAHALAEVEASAPRFDRSKAPIIMDVLRRQLTSTLYLQHSPRVLFVVADKSPDERDHLLNAIYYVDAAGAPLYRDAAGRPSRAQLEASVKEGSLPAYALDAHDYVYDVAPGRDPEHAPSEHGPSPAPS